MVRRSFVLWGILLIFAIMSPAYASQVSDHNVVVDVESSDAAHFNASLTYLELDTKMVTYLVFAPITDVRAWDSSGDLECSVDKQTYGSLISCVPNYDPVENYTVMFSFDSMSLVRKAGEIDIFSYSYGIKVPTEHFSFYVLLPVGASLASSIDFDPYYPDGAIIGTELGRRVSLEWVFDNPELGRTYSFDANYEFVGKPVVPIDDEGRTDYFMILAYVFGVGFAVFFVYFIMLKRKSKDDNSVNNVKRVFSVLKDDERKVVDVIMSKDGKCKQRDIVKVTDFSKAKVSRIMVELELRGIIKRERVGRTNKIVLNDNVDLKKPSKAEEKK